jgi:RecA-family ATPase
MFPRGKITALVADSGVGKTWVLVAATLSITSNIPFLPNEEYDVTDDKKVLIIDTEGRIKTFVQRIDILKGSRDNYLCAKDPLEIAVFTNEQDRQSIELVIQHQKIDLVIIDSLAGFNSVDENTCQVLECLHWLSKIALKYNCAIVFTQLINKSELKDGRITNKSVRGFSGIIQWCQLVWGLDVPTGDDSLKRLYQVKNNLTEKDTRDYLFQLTKTNGIVWKTFDIGFNFKSKKEQRLSILKENADKSNIDIAKLIQEYEPQTKLKSLEIWVARNRF